MRTFRFTLPEALSFGAACIAAGAADWYAAAGWAVVYVAFRLARNVWRRAAVTSEPLHPRRNGSNVHPYNWEEEG